MLLLCEVSNIPLLVPNFIKFVTWDPELQSEVCTLPEFRCGKFERAGRFSPAIAILINLNLAPELANVLLLQHACHTKPGLLPSPLLQVQP